MPNNGKLNQPNTGAGPQCAKCGAAILREREWMATPVANRKSLRRHGGRGLCTKCYKVALRDDTIHNYAPIYSGAPNIRKMKRSGGGNPAKVPDFPGLAAATKFVQDVARLPCQSDSEDKRVIQEWADQWFSYVDDVTEFAANLCGTCPVRQLCLEGAITRKEPWGVWGGAIIRRGEIVARQKESPYLAAVAKEAS